GWQSVLYQEEISVGSGSDLLAGDRGYTIFNFHQSQEAVRGAAIIRQYRVLVGFVSTASSATDGSTSSAVSADLSGLSAARWTLEYETGGTSRGVRIALACVFAFWVLGWLAWCYAVLVRGRATEEPKHKKGDADSVGSGSSSALYEHKCLAFLGLSAVLYLNPVMAVGGLAAPASASLGLASDFLLSAAVAVFLVAALCLADGVSRRSVEHDGYSGALVRFYAPKLAMGVATLMFMLLLDVVMHPNLTGWDHGPLEAMENWPQAKRDVFAFAASGKMIMFAVWAVWMMCTAFRSGRLLRKLPYVPTRLQQLSHRVFAVQALCLGAVYTVLALTRLIRILQASIGGNSVAAEFLLFVVNTRQDYTGSAWILCCFVLQQLLLFLPASMKECVCLRDIAVRYAPFESQVPQLGTSKKRKTRGHAARGRRQQGRGGSEWVDVEAGRQRSAGGSALFSTSGGSRDLDVLGETGMASPEEGNAKTGGYGSGRGGGAGRKSPAGAEEETRGPIFCVETAAWLLEVAEEAYRDPPGVDSPTDTNVAVADFGRLGLTLVARVSNVEHDTHCFILKDELRERLVIAFRGSVCRRFWIDKLRFAQTKFNLDAMMPVGRENETPALFSEEIMAEAWSAESEPAPEPAPPAALGFLGGGGGGGGSRGDARTLAPAARANPTASAPS
ncbi:unnamed protein product, partial [Scytosiphon promiscuus]